MVSTARRARTDWAATRIAAFIGLVFRMLWSVAAGLIFLVFLVTPLPLLRKATHFFLETTADSAACRVLALPEMWFHIARRSGLVGAWRLTGVCRAARAGAKEWLQKLPRLVVCGGLTDHGGNKITGEVWRLNLGDLRWERLPDLVTGGYHHACCAVRGGVVVLGGTVAGQDVTKISGERSARVEILGRDSSGAEGNHFKILPQLSCGPIIQSAVVVIDEIESDQGQVLLIGGWNEEAQQSQSSPPREMYVSLVNTHASAEAPVSLKGVTVAFEFSRTVVVIENTGATEVADPSRLDFACWGAQLMPTTADGSDGGHHAVPCSQ